MRAVSATPQRRVRQHRDRAGAEGGAERSQAGVRERCVERGGERHPGAEVAADQQRLRGSVETAGSARARPAADGPDSSSVMPGRPTAPPSVTSIEPGSSSLPSSRNQSGPWRAMSAMLASVSTFWTSVGRPRTPRSIGPRRHEGRLRGPAVQPLHERGLLAGDEAVGHGDELDPLALAGAAALGDRARPGSPCALVALRPTATTICARTDGAAAAAAPSSTRCGLIRISRLSLWLAGSPSTPFATTMGERPAATARSLRCVGKPAPPRPRRPLASTAAISALRLAAQRGQAAVARDVRGQRASARPPAAAGAGASAARARRVAPRRSSARPAAGRREVLGGRRGRRQQAQHDRCRRRPRCRRRRRRASSTAPASRAHARAVQRARRARRGRRGSARARQRRGARRCRSRLVTTSAITRSSASAPSPSHSP